MSNEEEDSVDYDSEEQDEIMEEQAHEALVSEPTKPVYKDEQGILDKLQQIRHVMPDGCVSLLQ